MGSPKHFIESIIFQTSCELKIPIQLNFEVHKGLNFAAEIITPGQMSGSETQRAPQQRTTLVADPKTESMHKQQGQGKEFHSEGNSSRNHGHLGLSKQNQTRGRIERDVHGDSRLVHGSRIDFAQNVRAPREHVHDSVHRRSCGNHCHQRFGRIPDSF